MNDATQGIEPVLPTIAPTRRSRWTAVDRAMAHLVKLITADEWDAESAARRLVACVPDVAVLERMKARTDRSLIERPSPIAERAAVTVRAALRLQRAT